MLDLEKALEEISKANAESRRADLSSANLSSADLSSANLSSADLRYANLSYADLRYADLRYADLRYANLSSADLRYADLRYANLSSAKLNWADHWVISHLLWCQAKTIEQEVWSAWLGKKIDYCHARLFVTVAKQAPDVLAWAMPLMQSWILEGDNAPSILKDWKPEASQEMIEEYDDFEEEEEDEDDDE